MSQKSKDILSKGILGAIAVSLTFGAAQYALGSDLAETQPGSFQVSSQISSPASLGASEAGINRSAKADRAGVAAAAVPTQTISLRFDGLPNTSVLVRVPVAKEARNNSTPSLTKSVDRMVACEPVVSVLTEVAKQLQPGRCVT